MPNSQLYLSRFPAQKLHLTPTTIYIYIYIYGHYSWGPFVWIARLPHWRHLVLEMYGANPTVIFILNPKKKKGLTISNMHQPFIGSTIHKLTAHVTRQHLSAIYAFKTLLL